MNDFLMCLLSGGVVVALIKSVEGIITWTLNRKAAKEDKAEERQEKDKMQAISEIETRLKNIERQNKAQSEALKLIMYDKIRYLGRAYIDDEEVDFDDRRILNAMHESYHTGLGGNGDLDLLMQEVRNLPLKNPR